VDVAQAFDQTVGRFERAIETIVEKLNQAFGGLASGVQGAAKAIDSLTFPIGAATKGLDTFVGALSPGTMLQFNRAIEDLNATIGVAFMPLFEVFTDLLRDIAAELAPAMRALAPVVRVIGETISALLLPAIKIVSTVIQALAPGLKAIADLLYAFADALKPLFTILEVELKVIGQVVSAIVTALVPVIKVFADALKIVTERMLLFAVSILKAWGANELVAGIIKSLKGSDDKGEVAAGNVGIKGVDRLNKDIMQLAFAASGNAGEKQKSDTDRLIEQIEKISPSETLQSIVQSIKDIVEWLQKIWDKLPGAPTFDTSGRTPFYGDNLIGRNLDAAGNALGDAWNSVFGD
jgi:hypothetical protein